jgi:hypothetical protein
MTLRWEEAGEAIVAKIQRAAELANENCDRAMKLAHKLAIQLRAAEDRINQLEADVQVFRERGAPRRTLASNNPYRRLLRCGAPPYDRIGFHFECEVGMLTS